jgi:hypothetical protein
MPLQPKYIFIISKRSHVYLDNRCAFIQFRKNIFFYGRCKNDKICLTKNLIFNTKFCLSYTVQMTSWYFMEGLCAHVACKDVHTNILFRIFLTFQNMSKMHRKNRSICTQKPKHHFQILVHYFLNTLKLKKNWLSKKWEVHSRRRREYFVDYVKKVKKLVNSNFKAPNLIL